MIAILNCVNKKNPGRQQAQLMYYGMTWDAKIAFIKQAYDEWYILSAKYGLIHPTTIIEPYNISFKPDKRFLKHGLTQELVDVKTWWLSVINASKSLGNEIHWHVGNDYFKPIEKSVQGKRIKQMPNHSANTKKYKDALIMYNEGKSIEECVEYISKPLPKNPESEHTWIHEVYGEWYGKSYYLWKQYPEQKLDQACLRKVGFGKANQHKQWRIKWT